MVKGIDGITELTVTVEVVAQKLGFKTRLHTQHVLQHQHLTVGIRASTNTNGGNIKTLGDLSPKVLRAAAEATRRRTLWRT